MSDPLHQHRALIEAAQAAQRMFAPTQQLIEQITKSSAFLTSHRSGLANAVLEFQRQREILEPALGVRRIAEQMLAAQTMADRLGKELGPTVTALSEQATKWQAVVGPAVRQLDELKSMRPHLAGLADSLVAWESTSTKLARCCADAGLIANRVTLAERLFVPSNTFAKFARETVSRIEQVADERHVWALGTSLQLAQEQLIATTDALGAFVVTPVDDDDVSASYELLSPYVQQEELLVAVEEIDEENQSALVEASPAANAVDLSRRVLTTIATCNEARKVSGDEEIFKPTTRLLEVYADMPWLIPTNKATFATFVDCLYFLFYEGAGKDKLRFLKSHGGPIDDADFDFILCIKHLRNKWTRHDADHGKASAIKKSWAELSTKFQSLGLGHMPVTPDDFRVLHVNLLAQSNAFVNKILRGLTDN